MKNLKLKNPCSSRINGPLIQFANFEDGSFINLIRIKKPYSTGHTFAIYQAKTNSYGLLKTLDKGFEQFNLLVQAALNTSRLVSSSIHHDNIPEKKI